MKYAVPPAMLLQDIRKAVDRDMLIFVDCGISSGMDAYKALALGADAVCVGNAFVPALRVEGKNGVVNGFRNMAVELKDVMCLTSVSDCSKFDPGVIHMK